MSALAIAEALEDLCEAAVATLPGSVSGRQGQRIAARMTREVRAYFERVERRFPTRKVLALAGKYLAKRPEDKGQTQAEKEKVQNQVAKIIGTAVASQDRTLERAHAEYSAVAYMLAAAQVEDSLRKQFRVRESALIEATLRADFLDQPIPLPVTEWARAEAATKVTAMSVTTQRELASTIADAMTQPRRGVPDVARAIRDRFTDMTTTRSELIATTEMNYAMSQGTFDRGAAMGATKKEWITAGDDRVSEICQGNGGAGTIPMERAFPSGDMQPPGHPRCRCALATFGATRATVRIGVSPEGRTNWLANVGRGVVAQAALKQIVKAAQ